MGNTAREEETYLHSLPLLPCSSVGKESACSAGDPGSIPGLGRSSGEGDGNPLQYPCLEHLMDREAWWAAVHGVAESGTTEQLTLTYFATWQQSEFPRAVVSTGFKRLPRIQMDFPGGSDNKASACNAADRGSIPGSGRSPGEGDGNPLQYPCLANLMDRRA